MSYGPPIQSASLTAEVRLGSSGLRVLLFEHPPAAEQSRMVKYRFSLAVMPKEGDEAVLYVTSEYNRAPRGGSHVLGVFSDGGHEHHGSSDEWADREKFLQRALGLVCDRLELAGDEVSIDQQSRE